ncbi:unnamed protein product [Closterium sp. Naga37s-1]|nr:unnamed protein product [Closterium sp. Naga37s-1]
MHPHFSRIRTLTFPAFPLIPLVSLVTLSSPPPVLPPPPPPLPHPVVDQTHIFDSTTNTIQATYKIFAALPFLYPHPPSS